MYRSKYYFRERPTTCPNRRFPKWGHHSIQVLCSVSIQSWTVGGRTYEQDNFFNHYHLRTCGILSLYLRWSNGTIYVNFFISLLSRTLRCNSQATFHRVINSIDGRILGNLYPTCKYDRLDSGIYLSFDKVDVQFNVCILMSQAFKYVRFNYVSYDFRFRFNQVRRQEIRYAARFRKGDAFNSNYFRRFANLISTFSEAKGGSLSQTIVINYCTGFAFDYCKDASFFCFFVQGNSSNYRNEQLRFADLLRNRNAYVGRFRSIFRQGNAYNGRNERFTR